MTTATISYAPADATDSAADLLQGIDDGDPAAWDEIFRRYSNFVYAAVRSFRLQEADALDAMQMTWLRLAENAHRVQFPERLGGWLATTARRECLHILRQAKLRPHISLTRHQKLSPNPRRVPSSTPSTRTPHGYCGNSSTSYHRASEPCYGCCSPTIPALTPRPPASPESRLAGSDPLGRGPCNSYATNSTTAR